jgi:hypothetical protein
MNHPGTPAPTGSRAATTQNYQTKSPSGSCPCSCSCSNRPRTPVRVIALSQADLDHEFVQYAVRPQTFLVFDRRRWPRLAPVFPAVERYAHAFQPDHTRHGVFLAGRAGIGKSHLIHVLINQARALGLPALSLTLTQLLALTLPERGEPPEQREERYDRRRILRRVPVLAIRDLGRRDLRDGEIEELSLLLEHREDAGLVTHFTGTTTPAQFRGRRPWGERSARAQAAIAALTQRIEWLCRPILTCGDG